MAKGKPSKWVKTEIAEDFYLGKSGITFKYWSKHQRRHTAELIVSVGGIRWYDYKAKKYRKKNWDQLKDFFLS